MTSRCYNKSAGNYHRYGGRGIVVCEFLRVSAANLLEIVGDVPSKIHTLGRIKTNDNYACGQCAECLHNGWLLNIRWETPQQQNRNRNNTRFFTAHGETKSISEWAETTGIKFTTFKNRVNRGIDPFANHLTRRK